MVFWWLEVTRQISVMEPRKGGCGGLGMVSGSGIGRLCCVLIVFFWAELMLSTYCCSWFSLPSIISNHPNRTLVHIVIVHETALGEAPGSSNRSMHVDGIHVINFECSAVLRGAQPTHDHFAKEEKKLTCDSFKRERIL